MPILTSPQSHVPALAVERWGQVLCKVQMVDDYKSSGTNSRTSLSLFKNNNVINNRAKNTADEEWNFAMTDATIALYTDDAENCRLIPRKNVNMVDLIDTDEIVVRVCCEPSARLPRRRIEL